jgi:hypothetical protein
MADKDVFRLQVPLDASGVKGFSTDRVVKAIAYGSSGPTLEHTVKFDANGKGTASFTFERNPGSLTVAVGPDSASSEDLKHLQTISVAVSASSWQGQNSYTIPVVVISPYYWAWWWNWCQTYTVTGIVLCPDGSPVAGATVCAFDVDAWWWWTSEEQVGCATTGMDGSFSIEFTRCCYWWPWWWWETREWLLDPYLVDRITAAVKDDYKIPSLPRATPQTSLAIFNQILASATRATRAGRIASVPVKANLAVAAPINPLELEPLRARLMEVLPKEFPLPIWPWYPWHPWSDCGANIIFQVSQTCGGQVNTVVDETVANTRWDIPNNLNVTLTTNSEACCAFSCANEGCPEGNCLVPTDICDVNVGSVGGNIGSSSTSAQVGLAYPGTQDRPFAGEVNLYGEFGDAVNVDYYEFLYSTTGAPASYVPLPLAAISAFSRQVLVVLPGPVFTWQPVTFAPNTISDGVTNHYVIETIQHYVNNNGPQTWDALTYNLLLALNSANVLTNGTYYLQLVGWQRPGYIGNLVNPATVPVCDPNPADTPVDNYWVVTLDNQAPGDTDPSGQPCGLHICTDQPISDIIQVEILHDDGTTTPIVGCGVVCVVSTDQLVVDFAAYDPDGFLYSYSLELLYGVDESVDLLSLGTPVASPIAPSWAPAPPAGTKFPNLTLVGPGYSDALAEGAASPVWYGGSMRLSVSATAAFPDLPCAYLMQLSVNKRPIVNCNEADYLQQNVSFQSFTVQACPSPS